MRMYHMQEAATEMHLKVKIRTESREFTFRFASEPCCGDIYTLSQCNEWKGAKVEVEFPVKTSMALCVQFQSGFDL